MDLVLAQLVPLEKLEYARVRGAAAKSKWDSVDPADSDSTSDSDGCPPFRGRHQTSLSLSLSRARALSLALSLSLSLSPPLSFSSVYTDYICSHFTAHAY